MHGFVSSQSCVIATLNILRTSASVRLAMIGARAATTSSNSRTSRRLMPLILRLPQRVNALFDAAIASLSVNGS